VRCG
jgi:hypothetical protein